MALDGVSDGGSSETVRDGGSVLTIGSTGAGPIIVPDNVFLLTAGFERAGADLRLAGKDGQSVLVKEYFAAGGTPADLETTSGATVTGETAKILAGSPAFFQLAQAGGGAVGPAAIGKVTALAGDVSVQRAGILLSATGPEKVQVDTPIYRNDVLQTGKGASVAVTFVDKTNFSLGEDARMAMNEFAYNPQTGKGQALLSVLQGSFSFVSGQVAKSGDDAIRVQMPTMTIGIRGTKVAGYAAAEGTESQVTLLPNEDGSVGVIVVFNRTSSYLITQANFTAYATSQSSTFQAPTLLVNLSKYQDTLSTLQKAIQSQGDRAALEKQSPVDVALARALNEVQTAGGDNQGGGGGFATQSFPDLGITLVFFQSGGDLFAAVFTDTDPIKTNTGPINSNNSTQGTINNEAPPAGPTQTASSNVITDEDTAQGGQVPPPEGSNPVALTFTLIVPPILGTVALAADGSFVYTPGTVLQALAQGEQAQDTFTVQVAGGPAGTVDQVISVNITGENDAPVAGPTQGQVFEDQAGATQGNVLDNAADVDNGAVLQVVSVNGIAIGSGGGGGGGNGGGTLQLTQTALTYLTSQGQSLANGLGGTANFGEGLLNRNDDGSTGSIDVSSVFTGGLNFFGTTYNALFVNNNGNITFTGPLSQFTPSQISAGLGNPIIAAFWADVDTRGTLGLTPTPGGTSTATNLVYYDLDTTNHVFTATWDDVGYYSVGTDKLNAFQLQLIDRGNGDFDIVFRYESVNWTTGDFSGGSGGLGGSPARAGYNSGNGEDFFELSGSGNQGQVLAWDETVGNIGQVGVYIFQVRGGEVVGGDGSVTIETDYGTLVMNADGSYTYTPDNDSALVQALAQGQVFNDQFTYTVADEFGALSQTTLTVAVTGTNDAPIGVDDANAIGENGTSVSGNVLGNDTDVDQGATRQVVSVDAAGDALSEDQVIAALSAGSEVQGLYGTLVLNADGSYTYTLDPESSALRDLGEGEQAQDLFVYTVSDGLGGTDTATLAITVTGTNDLPFANDDAIEAVEDGGPVAASYSFILSNDGDPDGTLTIVSVSPTSFAGATITLGQSSITYDAGVLFQYLAQGQTTTDSFTYTVSDPDGAQATATVTVTITGVNDAPVGVDDGNAVDEESSSVGGNVLANDTDVDDGAVLQATAGEFQGEYGTLVLNADGSYSYALDPESGALQSLGQGEQAEDSFTYTVSDGQGGSDTATLAITVTGTNDDPFATDDAIAAVEDGGPVATSFTTLLANDGDPEGNITIASVSATSAAGAAVSIVESQVVYDPGTLFQSLAQGQTTTDSFTYTITDNFGAQATATVEVTITGANDAPIGGDDANSIGEDGVSVGGNVLGNDTDVDNGAVLQAVAGAFEGEFGTLSLGANGAYTYTLNAAGAQSLAQGQQAQDSFVYTVSDGLGGSDTATLSIDILGANDAPIANDDANSIGEDGTTVGGNVLANDTDADAGAVLQAVAGQFEGEFGTLSLGANGAYTYTLNAAGAQSLAQGQQAQDSFVYTVSDGLGGSDTATLAIDILGANDAPVANDDGNSIGEDGVSVGGNVLANDTDVDNGAVLQALAGEFEGEFGTLSLGANGSYTYTLNAAGAQSLAQGQQAEDSFVYTVSDGLGGSDTATLSIDILGANDAPVANDDANSIGEDGTTVGGNVLANDTDADAGAVQQASPGQFQGQFGTLSLGVDGTYVYTLNAAAAQSLAQGQQAQDSFVYTVSDGLGGSDTATLAIGIIGANDAPIAVDGPKLVVSDDAGPIALNIAAPTDVDLGDVLSIMVTGVPTNGTISLANGQAVTNGQALTIAQLSGLTFTPTDGDGDASSAFTYSVADNHGGTDSGTVAIDTIDANHQTVVGYYDMVDGQGDADQRGGILANDFAAVNITAPTAQQLAGIDVFYVQNPLNDGYGGEYLANLANIAAAVANGMTLVIHDRHVTNAESILPGGGEFDIIRSLFDGTDIDVLAPDSLLADGPGGVITNTLLDNGNFSNHGYAIAGSLPDDAELLLSNGNASQIVAFSYAFGAGHVYYASIPLDFYLDGQGSQALDSAFQNVYAPNVIAYGASLGGIAEGHVFTGSAGSDILVGGGGNDSLVGNGGQDRVFGGAGDDRIVLKDLGFVKADGGVGNDVLAFDMNGTIDLSALSADKFAALERVDLTDGAADTLRIGMDQVLALNSEHQGPANTAENALKVLGDAGDTVQLIGNWQAGGQDSGGQGYQLYTLGDAKVAVEQQDLSVQVIN